MHKNHSTMNENQNHYRHLLIMAGLSFISMYILMYAMVNIIGNVYNSLNQFYMAGLMTAPMVLIELVVMRAMFQNQRYNALIIAASIVAGLVFFSAHPAADCHFRQAVPEIDDPASRWSHPHV